MRRVQAVTVAWAASLLLFSGCATGRLAAPTGAPIPDPAAVAAALRSDTRPGAPQQLNFGWLLDERGSRVRGRGVVRYEAPRRIRLDLFGARGETFLIAALDGEDYRVPPQAAAATALPTPTLLWAALSVFEPPADAALVSATRQDGSSELRFDRGGEVFIYTFDAEGETVHRLSRAERAGPQGVIESVNLTYTPEGDVSRANYRNWAEFRELNLEVESRQNVASFPEEIWRPDAVPR